MNDEQFLSKLRAAYDPFEPRIAEGIRRHRMGEAVLRLRDASGRPRPDATVEAQLIRHRFGFGVNSFMLGGYDTPQRNALWESRLLRLFNMVTVGFFWSAYEPQPGVLRYGHGAEPMHRRPPVDDVLAFCDQHGLTARGHNLFWATNHEMVPSWLPEDPEAWWPHIRARFEQIARRYAHRIRDWDVVNEFFHRKLDTRAPRDYGTLCYRLADELFPHNRLFINEATAHTWYWFRAEDSPYHLLIDKLLSRGCRIDGIGLQHHAWGQLHEVAGEFTDGALSPRHELAVLDHYGSLGRPIHISEITIASAGTFAEGERLQAEIVRRWYRMWFSHPAVEAIVWWNLADGAAYANEGRYLGGLIRPDLSPKPAYEALDELINRQWRTVARLRTDAAGEARLRGFFGRYRVTVNGRPCGEHELEPGREPSTWDLPLTEAMP